MRRRAAAIAIGVALTLASLGDASADSPPSTRSTIEAPDGTPVTFVSKDVATEVFVARGDVAGGTLPDPFVKLGVVPQTVNLAPGVYTVETSSPTSSMGHERIFVEQGAPLRVEVRSGDASVKTIGTVLIGLGVVAAVLGVVAIVSISSNDQHYNRFAIGLPLILGGAAGGGLGWALTSAGATRIVAPHLPPGGAPRSSGGILGASWAIRF